MSPPRISLIVAMDRQGVIGRAGGLPWKLSADLQRFKRLTMGHPIIMGRKTYDSIGRPLPGRTTIVISRQPDLQIPDAIATTSLAGALAAAGETDEVFVIGGGEIYSQALPRADRLYVTLVETETDGDTRFPDWDRRQWQLSSESLHPADDKNAYSTRFQIFDRLPSDPSTS